MENKIIKIPYIQMYLIGRALYFNRSIEKASESLGISSDLVYEYFKVFINKKDLDKDWENNSMKYARSKMYLIGLSLYKTNSIAKAAEKAGISKRQLCRYIKSFKGIEESRNTILL